MIRSMRMPVMKTFLSHHAQYIMVTPRFKSKCKMKMTESRDHRFARLTDTTDWTDQTDDIAKHHVMTREAKDRWCLESRLRFFSQRAISSAFCPSRLSGPSGPSTAEHYPIPLTRSHKISGFLLPNVENPESSAILCS